MRATRVTLLRSSLYVSLAANLLVFIVIKMTFQLRPSQIRRRNAVCGAMSLQRPLCVCAVGQCLQVSRSRAFTKLTCWPYQSLGSDLHKTAIPIAILNTYIQKGVLQQSQRCSLLCVRFRLSRRKFAFRGLDFAPDASDFAFAHRPISRGTGRSSRFFH